MGKQQQHEHTIRVPGGDPVLAKATLPSGSLLDWWDPPVVGGMMPNGLGEVEYLIDGVVVGLGTWPAVLGRVDAQ